LLFRASADAGIRSLSPVSRGHPSRGGFKEANAERSVESGIASISDKLVTINVDDAKGEAVVPGCKHGCALAKKFATITMNIDPRR
jgi:hypothetical protein